MPGFLSYVGTCRCVLDIGRLLPDTRAMKSQQVAIRLPGLEYTYGNAR